MTADPAAAAPGAPPAGLVSGLTSAVVAFAESCSCGATTGPGRDGTGYDAADSGESDARVMACGYCPVCRLIAAASQFDPNLVADTAVVARDVFLGFARAMTDAAGQRARQAQRPDVAWDPEGPL